MTLNSSGKISLGGSTAGQSFEYEVGSGTYPGYNQPISLNDSRVRQLTGNPTSGTTNSMNSLHGKSWRISVSRTYASSTLDPAVISTSTFSNYLAGYTDVTITVNSGVYLYTSVPSNYSLYLSDFTSGDTLTIVNNGYIVGRGGMGGGQTGLNGASGGPGIGIGHNLPTTLINNGYIAGGGGGGGGYTTSSYVAGGGGGAGGGAGGGSAASGTYVAGGAGGSLGGSGANGTIYGGCCAVGSGGGGGYILPGSGGNSAFGSQGGGAGGQGGSFYGVGGAGGSGGGVGGSVSYAGAGGGGWGASGGNSLYTSGGGGYPAISSYSTITISGSGTIYGAVNHA